MDATIDTSGKQNSAGGTARWAFIFVFALYFAWTGAWLLERYLETKAGFPVTSGGRFLYWLVMKVFLWILPSIMLLRASGFSVRGVMGCDRVRSILVWGGGTGLLLGTITLTVKWAGGHPLFASPLGWPLFSAVAVAPLLEEFTFRGAILHALTRRFRFWAANTITALLFLGIHMPGWHFQGRLLENLFDPVSGALSIFLLGLVFGWVAHRSKSVAAGVLAHGLNNLFNA
ncbi:MAG TPA: type II CAAX endopeptidase family protein [Candidatus Hydrogenedentes bacterium]|nr:type II CAAX endopeptidase family protein [Candidatus Hydrogenedentota bacterium]